MLQFPRLKATKNFATGGSKEGGDFHGFEANETKVESSICQPMSMLCLLEASIIEKIDVGLYLVKGSNLVLESGSKLGTRFYKRTKDLEMEVPTAQMK